MPLGVDVALAHEHREHKGVGRPGRCHALARRLCLDRLHDLLETVIVRQRRRPPIQNHHTRRRDVRQHRLIARPAHLVRQVVAAQRHARDPRHDLDLVLVRDRPRQQLHAVRPVHAAVLHVFWTEHAVNSHAQTEHVRTRIINPVKDALIVGCSLQIVARLVRPRQDRVQKVPMGCTLLPVCTHSTGRRLKQNK